MGLVDEGDLSFNQSFLQFNVKEKNTVEEYLSIRL